MRATRMSFGSSQGVAGTLLFRISRVGQRTKALSEQVLVRAFYAHEHEHEHIGTSDDVFARCVVQSTYMTVALHTARQV